MLERARTQHSVAVDREQTSVPQSRHLSSFQGLVGSGELGLVVGSSANAKNEPRRRRFRQYLLESLCESLNGDWSLARVLEAAVCLEA